MILVEKKKENERKEFYLKKKWIQVVFTCTTSPSYQITCPPSLLEIFWREKKKYEDELEISPFFAKNIPMKETQKILENVQMKVWL